MKQIFIFLLLFLAGGTLKAQTPKQFSTAPDKFIKELDAFVNMNKSKKNAKIFSTFEDSWDSGFFEPAEKALIITTANLMRGERLSAGPYFTAYLENLPSLKNHNKFVQWHDIIKGLLTSTAKRKAKPFLEFMRFSGGFFTNRALRKTPTGVSWYAYGGKFEMSFSDEQPVVNFKNVRIVAKRKIDSIEIKKTNGTFYPASNKWVGSGGRVTWERFGLPKKVYAELKGYEIDVTRTLYEAENVLLHYPVFFGDKVIVGNMRDKLVTADPGNVGSYPRFDALDHNLKITSFAKHLVYKGGFRLQGTTIYGTGTDEQEAMIFLSNDDGVLIYKGSADIFTIKREEKLTGERVNSVLYYGQDSIAHPSVNIKYFVKKNTLQLSRGKRGNDRNPFTISSHGMNLKANRLVYLIDKDSISFENTLPHAMNHAQDVYFESLQLFDEDNYHRYQNIGVKNPISVLKIMYDEFNGEKRIFNVHEVASRINAKLKLDGLQSLLYDLVEDGFINYYPEREEIELKDKISHYADASKHKIDYDYLKIKSSYKGTNAYFDIKKKTIEVFGVKDVEFSKFQRVAIKPKNQRILLKYGKNIDFDGKIYAGFTSFIGKDFHFHYDKYNIKLDSVRYFDLFLEDEAAAKIGKIDALSIASRIEHLQGVLLIDAPENKSGKDDLPLFPSLQTQDFSYVYYDGKKTLDGVYKRDSFYFRLDEFSLNALDHLKSADLHFKGKMFTADIFPVFKETLLLQKDYSLGFTTHTPSSGVPLYKGLGSYAGEMSLSNKGFSGKGTFNYLGASIDADDIIFRPKELTASAEKFSLKESRNTTPEIPQVLGLDVTIDWRPYQDSMYIRTKTKPFEIFKDNLHKLKGLGLLTSGGFKGQGVFEWDKAVMESNRFVFGAHKVISDTTDLKIKVFSNEAIALSTSNLNGNTDFDTQIAEFKSNDSTTTTVLPYNKFSTSLNAFRWDMRNQTLKFTNTGNKYGHFVSTDPEKDLLNFRGKTAFYDLKTNELDVGGVPFVVASDAFIYPEKGDIKVKPGGKLETLHNARIIADTINKYHEIIKATVDILGRKEYRASGYYVYDIPLHKQEIKFNSILGTRVGKGKHSQKRTVTRASGDVKEEDDFYIDEKIKFKGAIGLNAGIKDLNFHGYAKLVSERMPEASWFSIDTYADKKDLYLPFDEPKTYGGAKLRTGLYLSKETGYIYPRILMPLFFGRDREIFTTKGYIKYDKVNDLFMMGDSLKIVKKAFKGNILTFDNRISKVKAEGLFNIASGLDYPRLKAAGNATIDFVSVKDRTEKVLTGEWMLDLDFIIPKKLLDIILVDFEANAYNSPNINFTKETDFYKKGLYELFKDEKKIRRVIETINTGNFAALKKENKSTFLFGKVPMKWNSEYQSFLSTQTKIPLISIGGKPINKTITAYIEFRMPGNGDDRFYIYFKSPGDYYYFFGYKQGTLNLVSDNPRFNETLLGMKEKQLKEKMDDGEYYEIAPINPGSAEIFVNRVKEGAR